MSEPVAARPVAAQAVTEPAAGGNDSLARWRRHIDQLDAELLRLLNQRAAVACEIAAVKVASGLPAYDPARETQVLAKIAAQNHGPLEATSVIAIFESIIHETRRLGTKKMQQLSEK
ncbi:MAG TPA: chorismate mutase [Candidatus Angelobacter sp.]|jgi:chorismate mutase|nr:chorismate mutase [Candidatus Angelobacter sp.]